MYPDNSIINTDAVTLLKGFEDNSVAMIFADPPYGIGYHSNHYKGKNPHAPITHDWNFQIGEFLNECSRVLKDGGALYLCCRWDVSPLWIPLIPKELKLKTIIAWVKDNWSAGDLTGSFGNQYEQIIFIAKGRNQIRGKRYPNVWNFARVPARQLLHPAQKPLDLVKRAIEASSDIGDLIVDPFAGSGTTGLAAKETQRVFVVGDLDKQMVTLCEKRINGIDIERHEIKSNPFNESSPSLSLETTLDYGLHPDDIQRVLEYIAIHVQQVINDCQPPLTS